MIGVVLEQSSSLDEVCEAFGITRDAVNALIRDGLVGYTLGRKRSRRFFAVHVAQIRAALEVKATTAEQSDLTVIGVTPRSARRRARAS